MNSKIDRSSIVGYGIIFASFAYFAFMMAIIASDLKSCDDALKKNAKNTYKNNTTVKDTKFEKPVGRRNAGKSDDFPFGVPGFPPLPPYPPF
jgi:hypothetical protein